MKRLCFSLKKNLDKFISLCKENDIKFNLITGRNGFLAIEIPDTFENISFLSTNGYNID